MYVPIILCPKNLNIKFNNYLFLTISKMIKLLEEIKCINKL